VALILSAALLPHRLDANMTITADRRFSDGARINPDGNPAYNVCGPGPVDKSIDTKPSAVNDRNASTNNVRQRLRLETSAEHDAIERTLGLMAPALTKTAYRHCIAKFYGFYRPVERELAICLEGSLWGDVLSGRQKAGLLRHDLQCLGMAEPEATPVCTALPALTTPAAAFGCLYVFEGATLGGQIISSHAASRFGYGAQHGAAFFHGYGSETGAMWRTFGHTLTAYAARSATDDEIVAAAVATFRALRLWCESEEAA
jgi:heme oxygenase